MATAGMVAGLYISTNKIAELTAPKISSGAEIIDITSLDSAGWKESLAGLKDWSISSDGNLKMTDTNGQAALWTAYTTGASVSLVFRLGSTATPSFSGSAFVTKFEPGADVTGKQTISITLTGTGALTYNAS